MYSCLDKAPEVQPHQSSPVEFVLLGMGRLETGSDTAMRPPGLSTRTISLKTCGLSGDRLMTQFEMITSMLLSSTGSSSKVTFAEFHILQLKPCGLALGACEHFRGHIHADHLPVFTDLAGGQETIQPAAGTKVQDGLAGLYLRQADGVTAAGTELSNIRWYAFQYFLRVECIVGIVDLALPLQQDPASRAYLP